jgi:hypothetical protein
MAKNPFRSAGCTHFTFLDRAKLFSLLLLLLPRERGMAAAAGTVLAPTKREEKRKRRTAFDLRVCSAT